MAYTKAAMRNVEVLLQAAGSTTGNGTAIAIPPGFLNHNIIIRGSAGIGAGAVQIETSREVDYSGTWAPIGGGPVSAVASSEVSIPFEGAYNFVRARISTTVTGGTITVGYIGTK